MDIKYNIKKIIILNIGFFFCALGTVFYIKSGSGMAPWEVFHSGVAKTLGIRIGRAGILTSAVIIAIDYFLGARIGIGTVFNMINIGIFTDFIISLDIIKTSDNFIIQILFLFVGMFFMNIGIWLYISQGWGAGPRDGLMVALAKKTKFSVQFLRSAIETTAVILGFLLGGSFGIGTIICAFAAGPVMKLIFDFLKFDVKAVKHIYIDDYIKRDNLKSVEESGIN
ncbi:MAG: YczE/YyaS/YitT family protein [Proteocatella sp.]